MTNCSLPKQNRPTRYIHQAPACVSGPEFYGVLVDLSGLGCLCQIKAKGNGPLPSLDINTTVQLRCLLPGLKKDQELTGIVKNFKMSSADAGIGLEFSGLQDYLREVIEKYVYSVETITR